MFQFIEIHESMFVLFMVTSEVYMLLSCLLYRWGHTNEGRKMTPNVSTVNNVVNIVTTKRATLLFENKQFSQNAYRIMNFERTAIFLDSHKNDTGISKLKI